MYTFKYYQNNSYQIDKIGSIKTCIFSNKNKNNSYNTMLMNVISFIYTNSF